MKMLCVAAMAFLMASCSTITSAREKLAEMPETEYLELVVKVDEAGAHAGARLAQVLEGNTEIALSITHELQFAVTNDLIDVADIVRHVADQYGTRLGLTAEQLEYVRDAAKVLDVAVGQIRLGIDGKLTVREKELVMVLLMSLERGLME